MAPAMRSCQCGEWLTGGDDGDDDADAGCSTSALALAVEEEDAVIFSNNIEHFHLKNEIGSDTNSSRHTANSMLVALTPHRPTYLI
jgi:hypothetical protein